MRKKIALFTNGWSSEFLQEVGQGILSGASIADVDLFLFTSYSMRDDASANQNAEFSIFKLPDLNDFDGAIIMASTFNLKKEFEYLERELERTNIPAISLEYKLNGADYFGTDEYCGMTELVEHLIEEHSVKDVVFIGGMPDHQGSNIRLKAVKDTLSRYALTIPDSNILFGLFAANPAKKEFQKWLYANENLPDAVICANDVMAIGICDWLKEHNINVPSEIIVTGFDCLKSGQVYEPSLTTVNREWYSMGVRCIEKLLGKIAGKTDVKSEEIQAHLVCGESCCHKEDNTNVTPTLLRKATINNRIDGFSCDQHFRHMFAAMRKCNNLQELSDNLSNFFIKEGWLEGKDILVAFNPNFFHSEDWNTLKTNGYPKEMDLVCNIFEKTRQPIIRVKTNESIFAISSQKKKCGLYIFVPIRVDEVCPAYAMLSTDFSIFQKDVLYLWCRHMSQYTEQVKSNAVINQLNKRLEALSITDALTGIYNRTGCESVMYPGLEQNQLSGGQSVVMLADVDHLKYINDTFGHSDGDVAIQTTVKVLQSSLPEGFMIGRYGGDEFLIAGLVAEEIDIDHIVKRILDDAAYESRMQNLPYTLSISIGAIQLQKGEDFNILDCIQKSDQKMYKMKSIHHQENTTKRIY